MGKFLGLVAGMGAGVLFAQTCSLREGDPHAGLSTTRVARSPTSPPVAPAETPDALFARTVRPILAERCAPCHNPGGSMYARLPFDDPKTVADHRGGIVKRIKGEERAALEAWLARVPEASEPH